MRMPSGRGGGELTEDRSTRRSLGAGDGRDSGHGGEWGGRAEGMTCWIVGPSAQ